MSQFQRCARAGKNSKRSHWQSLLIIVFAFLSSLFPRSCNFLDFLTPLNIICTYPNAVVWMLELQQQFIHQLRLMKWINSALQPNLLGTQCGYSDFSFLSVLFYSGVFPFESFLLQWLISIEEIAAEATLSNEIRYWNQIWADRTTESNKFAHFSPLIAWKILTKLNLVLWRFNFQWNRLFFQLIINLFRMFDRSFNLVQIWILSNEQKSSIRIQFFAFFKCFVFRKEIENLVLKMD